ncbi:unnamed protein product [Orchesella dallaii]|uniref:Bifunctional chitinase/lysozyme n=1 Tax=Orchesella dallaii TaxID=48710 RepID=A0ABP1QWS1_9HEXA
MATFKLLASISLLFSIGLVNAAGPKFAPYFDVTFLDPGLPTISSRSGQNDFTLAFVLGGTEGCVATWASQFALDDPTILNPIKEVQNRGGEMILAFGGALGNYLEHRCSSASDLANAYKRALDIVGSNHLDIDVEAPIDLNIVNGALAQVQRERPEVTVSYTLMVQGDDYGVTPSLGVDVLVSAKRLGVRVDVVNAMTMEFPSSKPSWGDAVISAANATLYQMKEIWPEKSDQELRKMLGVTPMIGRNFNGKKFETSHGRQLVDWANENGIGYLSFWSSGRDNGGCNDIISPTCSGVEQDEFEFIRIFQNFRG